MGELEAFAFRVAVNILQNLQVQSLFLHCLNHCFLSYLNLIF